MNLRSRSTPNTNVVAPSSPGAQTTKRSTAATKATPKRKVSETDFESNARADGSPYNENSDACTTTTTRSQRRRTTRVENEVVVPTLSKPLDLKSQPQPTSPVAPLAPPSAQSINASDALESTSLSQDPPKPAGECTTIVARDSESALIQSFLSHHLGPPPASSEPTLPPSTMPITSSSLYICGSPGVGKTALVTQLLSAYPRTHATVIHINCFSLRPPEAVYAKIVRLLSMALGVSEDKPGGTRRKHAVGVKHVEALIREHVMREKEEEDVENALPSTPVKKRVRKANVVKQQQSIRKQPPVILVLDELDALYPPSTASSSTSPDFPAVLYSLFSLTQLLSPTLALIGIANALDLTARLLPHLTGLLAPLTLTFHSYSVPSLVHVLQSRFGQHKLKPAAAMFIARAVAKDSSDVRKALAIARDAVARSRRAGKDAVDIKEVHAAIKGTAAKAVAAAAAGGASSAGAAAAGMVGVAGRVRAKPAHAKMALAALVTLIAPTTREAARNQSPARPFAGQVNNGSHVAATSSLAAADSGGGVKASSGPPTCMQLYNAYCQLVAHFPTVPLKPVHDAEFVDLVAVLEHDRLVRLMRAPGAAASAGGGGGTAPGARSKRSTGLVKDEVKGMRLAKVVLEADVEEVRRGLTTASVGSLEENVPEEEGGGRTDLVGEYLREVLGVET